MLKYGILCIVFIRHQAQNPWPMTQSEGSLVFGAVDGVDTQSGHGALEWLVYRMTGFSGLPARAAGAKPISIPAVVRALDTFDWSLCLQPPKILKLRTFVISLVRYACTRFFLASVLQRYYKPSVVWVSQGRKITGSPIAKSAHWHAFRSALYLGTISSA